MIPLAFYIAVALPMIVVIAGLVVWGRRDAAENSYAGQRLRSVDKYLNSIHPPFLGSLIVVWTKREPLDEWSMATYHRNDCPPPLMKLAAMQTALFFNGTHLVFASARFIRPDVVASEIEWPAIPERLDPHIHIPESPL